LINSLPRLPWVVISTPIMIFLPHVLILVER